MSPSSPSGPTDPRRSGPSGPSTPATDPKSDPTTDPATRGTPVGRESSTTRRESTGPATGPTTGRPPERSGDSAFATPERTEADRPSRRERRAAAQDERAGRDREAKPDKPVKPAPLWQSDLGLLAMRLVLATSFIGHGSQKLFGAFDGSGISGFAHGTLSGYGFRHTETLAWVTGLTELVGGVLVAIGFLTPLAAAGLLAIMINTVVLKFHDGFFFQDNGFEIDLALAGLAGGVLLNGPGRIALDAGGFLRRLLNQRWLFLAIAVGSALAIYFLLRN